MKCCQYLFAAAVLSLSAAWVQADVIPANRLPWPGTWQAAGVPGGIPDTSRWTVVDVTATQSLDNTGAVSAVAGINAAITAASANTVLLVTAGTYKIDAKINIIKNNVVLRGTRDASFGSAGATIFVCSGSNAMVYAGQPSAWGTPTAITGGDIAAGTTVLAVTSASGFAAGKMIRILQDNDATIPVLNVNAHAKLQGQISLITQVRGTNITISPALIFPLQSALNPTASCNANGKSGIGIENIYFDGTNKTGAYFVELNCTKSSWIKGCFFYDTYKYAVYWQYAVQCEYRHNRNELTQDKVSNNAGLKLDSSDSNLIIDNIFIQQFPSVQINGSYNYTNSASAGNVAAYNYSRESTNASGYAGLDYESSHGPVTQYDLWEGNIGDRFSQDGYYGSAYRVTAARNWFTGDNALTNQNNRAVDLGRFTRQYNIVGNLLGSPSRTFTYKNTTEHPAYTTRYIYRFGCPNMDNGGYSGTAQPSVGNWWADYPTSAGASGYQELDLDVEATTLFKGNYNTKDAAIPAGEALGSSTVANSYFLSGKPGWFGDLAWPAFGPGVTPNFSFDAIPAGYRYVHGVDPPGSDTIRAPTVATTSIQVF